MLAQLALEQLFHIRTIFGGDPSPLLEQVGQRRGLLGRPGGTDLGESRGIDEVDLQGKHTEQQVSVGVHGLSISTGRTCWDQPRGEVETIDSSEAPPPTN